MSTMQQYVNSFLLNVLLNSCDVNKQIATETRTAKEIKLSMLTLGENAVQNLNKVPTMILTLRHVTLAQVC